jgi:hypothetical protein
MFPKLLISLLPSPLEIGLAALVLSMLRPSNISLRYQFRKGVQGLLLLVADK